MENIELTQLGEVSLAAIVVPFSRECESEFIVIHSATIDRGEIGRFRWNASISL